MDTWVWIVIAVVVALVVLAAVIVAARRSGEARRIREAQGRADDRLAEADRLDPDVADSGRPAGGPVEGEGEHRADPTEPRR